MADRNADLVDALKCFKTALITHLASQPNVSTDEFTIILAANRILSQTVTALAKESFTLEEAAVQHIINELMYSS